MSVGLFPHQTEALSRMHNGCILVGAVGSGKSRTGIAYFFQQIGGSIDPFSLPTNPHDLFIITTARKRDAHEWDGDLLPFLLSTDDENPCHVNVTVDSWNNIKKYQNIYGAFFIFDEDHVTGSGSWVKSFYKIANKNKWIILSATPGDRWEDYIPVFVANRFYKNKTAFLEQHAIFNPFVKYRKIEKWIGQEKLAWCRKQVIVQMKYQSARSAHHEYFMLDYDKDAVEKLNETKWNPFNDTPIKNASEFCSCLRKIINIDESRQIKLLELCESHKKIIVFYNFDYELNILKNLSYPPDMEIAEYNGHKHEPIPNSESWVYLTQYASSSEAWNTTQTDSILFYSENYSYKTMVQAAGRIDRLTSPFKNLWYYHFSSNSPIDKAITKALKNKKDFNDQSWCESNNIDF